MATCAGRNKMVFSFFLHVCQPPFCCLPLQGRDLFTRLAVSVFPLCLILEKQILGSCAWNVLTAVCISRRKQKVWAPCYHRYLLSGSITFGSLSVSFCSQMLSSIAHRCSHAVWFRLLFLQIKSEVIWIGLWNLGIGAGRHFLATQSYLSCRCFSRGLSGKC